MSAGLGGIISKTLWEDEDRVQSNEELEFEALMRMLDKMVITPYNFKVTFDSYPIAIYALDVVHANII